MGLGLTCFACLPLANEVLIGYISSSLCRPWVDLPRLSHMLWLNMLAIMMVTSCAWG